MVMMAETESQQKGLLPALYNLPELLYSRGL